MDQKLIVKEFRPSVSDFKKPEELLKKILNDPDCIEVGIAKIIPPRRARHKPVDMDPNLVLPGCISRVTNTVNKTNLIYLSFPRPAQMRLHEFKTIAEKWERNLSLEDSEIDIWSTISNATKNKSVPIYAIDNRISLFPDDTVWNFDKFENGSILNGLQMDGINTSYTNFGMRGTFFGMHVEDSLMASMNMLHFGAPKTWYSVPAAVASTLEQFSKKEIEKETACDLFIRHKALLYPPEVLRENNIPFGKVHQYEGEIIVTMYQGYHQGYNNGYNCSESMNYATSDWREFYGKTKLCHCSPYGKTCSDRHALLGKFLESSKPEDNKSKNRPSSSITHLPRIDSKPSRSLCALKCQQRTNVFCKDCNVFLCFTSSRNCYAEYHKTMKNIEEHMPIYEADQNRLRCLLKCNPDGKQTESNLTNVRCTTCDVFLCFNHNRNCFEDYHNFK